MANVDDLRRLLDNKWAVLMFRNDMGSYTAVAVAPHQDYTEAMEGDRQITDDFSPSKALCRLSEKMIGNIVGVDDTPNAEGT